MSVALDSLDQSIRSPDERFVRYTGDPIGQGSFKVVFKAYDTEEGIEVAWNQLDISKLDDYDKNSLSREIDILSSIHCENIIQFYGSFHINIDGTKLVFITELMTSGTVRQFLQRVKTTNLRVVKKWCRQVLQGLDYLHSQTPKIIHRDLKCDNIFINGNHGEVKIGDLGLSRKVENRAVSVAGTPEFMAPECYDGNYDEKADIYSFGLCLLEMVTFEYPYAECTTPVQIWKKVSNYMPPASLESVNVAEVNDIIKMCLGPANQRPSASILLSNPFFQLHESDSNCVFVREGKITKTILKNKNFNLDTPKECTPEPTGCRSPSSDIENYTISIDIEDDTITFNFDPQTDSIEEVAREMINGLGLQQSMLNNIIKVISDALLKKKLCVVPPLGAETPEGCENVKSLEGLKTPMKITTHKERRKSCDGGKSASSMLKKRPQETVDVESLIDSKLKTTLLQFDSKDEEDQN